MTAKVGQLPTGEVVGYVVVAGGDWHVAVEVPGLVGVRRQHAVGVAKHNENWNV